MGRGFKQVKDDEICYKETVRVHGKVIEVTPDYYPPTRASERSAGYDFYAPVDVTIHPFKEVMVWTNVKAYMEEDEVLKLYPRSSLGSKGMILQNTVGVIDADYYENNLNDGNIGVKLYNTSGTTIQIKAGERFVQGVFQKYLKADDEEVLVDVREGGFGSSGK